MSEIGILEQEVSDTIIGLIRNCFRERKGEGIFINLFYESKFMDSLKSYVKNGRAEEVIQPIMEMLFREVNSLWETEIAYQFHLSRNGSEDSETYTNNELQEIRSKRTAIIKAMNAPEDVFMAEMAKARKSIEEIFSRYKPVSVRREYVHTYR